MFIYSATISGVIVLLASLPKHTPREGTISFMYINKALGGPGSASRVVDP